MEAVFDASNIILSKLIEWRMRMIQAIIIISLLLVAILILRGVNLYKRTPTTYEQLLKKGLVLELLLLKKQAIAAYELGLVTLQLSREESSNLHYLIGIINQKENNAKEAVVHFDEAFRVVPDYLQYRKEYQRVLDAYEAIGDERLGRMIKLFKEQSRIDGRYAKLNFPEYENDNR